MSTPADPLINIRAKTQLVSEGITRYMGEQWQMPLREGLGLVGEGEAEQWLDGDRPLVWAQNAPGPHESWQQYGDPQTQGSREGAIGGGLGGVRGGMPGDQQRRQIVGQNTATFLQPQQYDDYRSASTAGFSGPTDQWWQKGAIEQESPGQALTVPISPVRAGAQAGQPTTQMPGAPPQRSRHGQPPQRGPQPMSPRRPMPPQRDDRREARHERRDERGDHEARHERREDRYEKRHEASDNRPEARHERRDERGEREAQHERRDERGERSREYKREGRRHGGR